MIPLSENIGTIFFSIYYRFSNLESDCFGGDPNYVAGESLVDYSKNAYMLVYEKRRKEPIKVIIP